MFPLPTPRFRRSARFAALPLLTTTALVAQTVSPAARDEPIIASPFVVNSDADTGYAASSTLAGSRFKTDLKDTAASISVLTRDFLNDVGANNLTEAMRYSVNGQLDVASAGTDGSTPNGNSYQGGPAEFIVRGQPTTRARNYFNLSIGTDNYNVDRIEDSRGPNSVLFGFGAPGGIINISTKQALTDRSKHEVTLQGGSFKSHRETIDLNQVVIPGKLAIRLNAVDDLSNKFQEYAFEHNRRYDVTATYRPTNSLTLRADYERALIRENKPRPWTLFDGGVLLWQQLGAKTYATPIATNAGASITRFSSTRRLVYVGNDNTVIESALTDSTFDPAPTAIVSILDPKIASPTINYGGPGQVTTYQTNTAFASAEQRLGQHTFVELAYNHEDQARLNFNPGQTNLKLIGDPNQFLRTGAANPHAGEMYMETTTNSWERNKLNTRSDDVRVTASTELDAGKWGDYRLAAMAEYDSRADRNIGQREVWAGRPYNAAPENAANQVKRRTYVTPGVWSTYFINGGSLISGVTDPITGQKLSSTWVARSQSQLDDPATQKNALIAGQARYFNGRIVVGGGYREDKLEIKDRTAQRDPVTNEWSLAYATQDIDRRSARNESFGVVAHVTDNLSLSYNRANNQGLGGNERLININDLNGPVIPSPNSKGQGQDYGATVTALDNRVALRVVRYTTDANNLSDSFSPTGVGPDKVSTNIMTTLQAAGLVSQATADAHTVNSTGLLYDMVSKGYEATLTANPTRNWRVQANYSYTDSHFANYGREVQAWMDHEITYWRSFNQGSRVTTDGRTIDEAIAFMQQGFAKQANLAQIGEPGLRKHKVNVFTRYDLPWEPVKGLYVGGGYVHQSKALAGTDVTNTIGFYGNSYWIADALVGYKFSKAVIARFGRYVDGLTLQLNVTNVFDRQDPLITRIQPDGVTPLRAVVQEPRTWKLQARFDF